MSGARLCTGNSVMTALADKTHLVVHHSLTADSGTVSWGAIRKYHVETMKWRAIGYHFGIERIGDYVEVLLGRPMHEVAAAVKEDRMNARGIHVCIVGNYDEIDPPADVWAKAVELAAFLTEMLEIPVINIEPHSRYAPYKSCPGARWSMERFRADVAAKRKAI